MLRNFPEYREMSVHDVYVKAQDYCNQHIAFEFGLDGSCQSYVKRVRQSRPDVDAAWVDMYDKYVAYWLD